MHGKKIEDLTDVDKMRQLVGGANMMPNTEAVGLAGFMAIMFPDVPKETVREMVRDVQEKR